MSFGPNGYMGRCQQNVLNVLRTKWLYGAMPTNNVECPSDQMVIWGDANKSHQHGAWDDAMRQRQQASSTWGMGRRHETTPTNTIDTSHSTQDICIDMGHGTTP